MNQVRLQKARDMGADYAIDAGAEDAVAAVKAVTDGRGADYVIEAVGSIPTYRQAFDMVRRGGTLVAYGAAPSTASLDLKPFDIYSRELTIVGSYAGTYATWPEAIALIQAVASTRKTSSRRSFHSMTSLGRSRRSRRTRT